MIGILDPLTRQHTATAQGGGYEELKKVVLEFANNAGGTSSKMQIGRAEERHDEKKEEEHESEEYLWALKGKGKGKGPKGGCHICGGRHYARECPQNPEAEKGKQEKKQEKDNGQGKEVKDQQRDAGYAEEG